MSLYSFGFCCLVLLILCLMEFPMAIKARLASIDTIMQQKSLSQESLNWAQLLQSYYKFAFCLELFVLYLLPYYSCYLAQNCVNTCVQIWSCYWKSFHTDFLNRWQKSHFSLYLPICMCVIFCFMCRLFLEILCSYSAYLWK